MAPRGSERPVIRQGDEVFDRRIPPALSGRSCWMSWRVIVVAVTTAVTVMVLAPSSSADATADLRSAVAAKRGTCPALQSDPVLDGVAQRANLETQNYAGHSARFQPMEDPMPMLRKLSYPAGKAKLFAGFGDTQETAIYGATLFGSETLPDCTYTRYGADVLTSTSTANTTAAIVLVGD